MAAEYLDTWAPAALIAAHTALRDLLDGAVDPAMITIHDAADVLLAVITLTDPCGSVDAQTGQFTLVQGAREESAPNGGAANHGTIRDGAGTAYRSLPCQAGTTPVSGKLVLNTLTIVQGGPVELVSATIG